MKLLAIDTATEGCSAALYLDGEVIEQYSDEPRSHADKILPMVDTLLAEANITLTALDALAFDRGPGSFTGVRIGTSVAQGLALGTGLPLVPVSSLMTLAHSLWRQHGEQNIIAMLDARMQEIYWACYRGDDMGVQLDGEEQISIPQQAILPSGEWSVAGSGWSAYQVELKARDDIVWTKAYTESEPRAADLVRVAARQWHEQGGVEPEQALPVYLRQQVVQQKKR